MAFFDPFGGSGSGGSGGGSGAPGKDGRGISSIVFVSSTGGSIAGIAGATDTYRINYTDGTTSTYTVKNSNRHYSSTSRSFYSSNIFKTIDRTFF